MLKALVAVFLSFSVVPSTHAMEFDKFETIDGVELKSGKSSSVRHYYGKSTKTLPHSLEQVKARITNFEEKCNNEYRSKRKFTSPEKECKYHNEHLVESFIVRTGADPQTYLVGRRIYNRGEFSHYDLIQIKESKNEKGQKQVIITQTMLEDEEVKRYMKPELEKDSAFTKSSGTFVLTELGKSQTELVYEYRSQTDHWLLNKEISVPQVFASMSKSIDHLFQSIEGQPNRDLASN